MKPEVKAKWVAALRSGEYKQHKHMLKRLGSHCCLGVLCEVSKLETGFGVEENLSETSADQVLSWTVMSWAGLSLRNGDYVSIGDRNRNLSSHNDSGKTFAQIADAIEAQL